MFYAHLTTVNENVQLASHSSLFSNASRWCKLTGFCSTSAFQISEACWCFIMFIVMAPRVNTWLEHRFASFSRALFHGLEKLWEKWVSSFETKTEVQMLISWVARGTGLAAGSGMPVLLPWQPLAWGTSLMTDWKCKSDWNSLTGRDIHAWLVFFTYSVLKIACACADVHVRWWKPWSSFHLSPAGVFVS